MGAETQDRRVVRLRTLLTQAQKELKKTKHPAARELIERRIDRYLDEYHALLGKQ